MVCRYAFSTVPGIRDRPGTVTAPPFGCEARKQKSRVRDVLHALGTASVMIE